MSGVTGIELGPSSCVLVRTGREGSAGRAGARRSVTAARTFDARDRGALVDALRDARRDYGFSPRARVVAWSAPGSQVSLDLDHLPDISPIVAAGFDVESIVSPAQALALMLESQHIDSRRSAVAAVTMTVHGAAIAIVHHGQVVSARTFHWTLGEPFSGERPELLERCLVISQLAPHLQHLIELAGPVYNAKVSSIVVCGSLPDLRSLSMLLIEEMDLEVETLDSTDLLSPAVLLPPDSVASLQLAAALSTSAEPPPPATVSSPAAADLTEPRHESVSSSTLRNVVGAIAFVLCASWASMQVAGSAPAASAFPDGFAVVAVSPAPAASSLPRPEATMGRIEPVPLTPPPEPVPPGAPAPAPTATPAVVRPPVLPVAPDPLPHVDGIAISRDRRLAILDGAIVGPGDRVGRRVITRIERDGVYFREPGGREVFVAIRMRKPPPAGS